MPPRSHTMPVGSFFSTFEPRSPTFAYLVVRYSAPAVAGVHCPPAMPHGSKLGAFPGALHGLNRYTSSGVLAFAFRLRVRCIGSTTVAFIPLPQMSLLKTRLPFPVHALQPMVPAPVESVSINSSVRRAHHNRMRTGSQEYAQPLENQKHCAPSRQSQNWK